MNLDLNIDVKSLGKVAVLMGGTSAEREVSLTMSGPGVLAALRSQGVDAHAFDPSERGLHELKSDGFDRCFIALHGRHGEDGTVQGALELLGIPYTGSGVMASAIAIDKIMTKRLWLADGLSTPRSLTIARAALTDAAKVVSITEQLGLPLIVKPPHEGSSIGIAKVEAKEQMQGALEHAAKYDDELLCEEFVVGAEVTCPVLGEGANAIALPVIEIEAVAGNYDYQNKYFTDTTVYRMGHLPEALEQEIRGLALKAFRSLGCRGWGRADLMLRKSDGKPFLLEMNTSPGMTSHSLVPKSAGHAGLSYEQLCLWLIAQARLDSSQT